MKKLIFGMIGLLLIVPFTTLGATYQTHERALISLPMNDDFYVVGGKLQVDSPINGDLVMAGGEIEINSNITNDLIVAGGRITINGTVGDDARIAGGEIDIYGNIIDDLIVVGGGQVHIYKDSKIGGDLIINGGEIRVDGTVNGNLIINGGRVILDGTANNIEINGGMFEISGTVNGISKIVSEEIIIDSSAKFNGDVNYWTKKGRVDFGSAKATYNVELGKKINELKRGIMVLGFGIKSTFFVSGILAILILIYFRKFFTTISSKLEKNIWRNFGIGILYFILTPIATIFLFMTLVGIPLALLLMAFYGFSIFFAVPIVSVVSALYLEKRYKKKWSTLKFFGTCVGVYIALGIIMIIPLFGGLLEAFLVISIFGAILTYQKK